MNSKGVYMCVITDDSHLIPHGEEQSLASSNFFIIFLSY